MSELTVADIRCFRPTLVREARERLEADRQQVQRVMTELLASRPHAVVWSGPAALAAFARTVEMVQVLSDIARRLGETGRALSHLAERMQACLELVRHAERQAADAGGWLNHEGQLFLPQPPACADPVLVAHHARRERQLREEIERDLLQAESVARQADSEASSRLAAAADAAARSPAPVGRPMSLPAPPLLTGEQVDPASAFANAAWWRGLTPEEKGRAIRDHPEWVGPRDGVPAWARHQANLVLLTRAEDSAERGLAEARRNKIGGPPGRWAFETMERRVAALRAVRDVLSQQDGVPRLLLALSEDDGMVTAALSVGDVDRARHVATFVGGLTTTVQGDLRRYDRQFTAMRAEARSIARDGDDVAVVAWLGYPAPQWSGVGRPSTSVLRPTIARDHSEGLAAFLTGLDAARDVPLHSTVWAHSYGSTLAGHALLKTSAVDDVALVGSPGVPFRKLEDTGLKPNGLNVLDAPDDLVPYGGPELLGVAPTVVAGMRRLATVKAKGMPNDLRTAHGHSDYFAPGTVSRRSLVAIAAGRSDLVLPVSDEEVRRPRSIVVGYGPVRVTVPVEPSFR